MTPPNLALHGKSSPATDLRARGSMPVRSASLRRAAAASPLPAASGPLPAPVAPPPTPAAPPATRGRIRPTLAFDHLGEREVTIAYETHGDLAAKTPAGIPASPPARRSRPATGLPTLVLGGISAGRHLAPATFDAGPGWWPGIVGRGLALDPSRRPLIGIDYLGGADPGGECIRPVTTHDQARAIAAVLDHLGIARASFVGSSYGGMVALAFAELFPARTGRLVVLCAAHRTHPMATAVRSVQRAAVGLGVDSGDPARGLSLARALAMTTYRSTGEFEERFSSLALSPGTPGGDPARFPVQEYIEARGADFVHHFDTERYLALSESIDLHATRPDSLPERALLVSFDTDILVPPWLMNELAARDAGAGSSSVRHVTIPSLFGHDAFLKETPAVSALLRTEPNGGAEAVPASPRPELREQEVAR